MTKHSNGEWVLVPKSAIDWLMGEAPDSAGYWFGEFPEGYVPVGRFWWRDHFDALISAAPTPPSTDRIAALEAENKRLRSLGGQLANVAYNIVQRGKSDDQAINVLNRLYREWDAALKGTEP